METGVEENVLIVIVGAKREDEAIGVEATGRKRRARNDMALVCVLESNIANASYLTQVDLFNFLRDPLPRARSVVSTIYYLPPFKTSSVFCGVICC